MRGVIGGGQTKDEIDGLCGELYKCYKCLNIDFGSKGCFKNLFQKLKNVDFYIFPMMRKFLKLSSLQCLSTQLIWSKMTMGAESLCVMKVKIKMLVNVMSCLLKKWQK